MECRITPSNCLPAVALVLLLCLGNTGGVAAAELLNLDVGQEGGSYTVRLEMELDVTADYVRQVLTSYHQLHRMNPSIVESRVLPSPSDEFVRVFTRMKSCVLFFCNEFIRVEDVYQSASGDLRAVIVPEQSDFKAGTASWQISEHGERTLLVYEASMQPGFFIPPMIGGYLVKEKIKDELLVSFNRIECCASSRGRLGEGVTREKSMQVQHRGVC